MKTRLEGNFCLSIPFVKMLGCQNSHDNNGDKRSCLHGY